MLGPEHSHTLICMTHLANTYRNQGQWIEAEMLDVQVMETTKTVSILTPWQVMETRKTVLRPDPDTLTTMANLACTFRDQGRWTEAEKL